MNILKTVLLAATLWTVTVPGSAAAQSLSIGPDGVRLTAPAGQSGSVSFGPNGISVSGSAARVQISNSGVRLSAPTSTSTAARTVNCAGRNVTLRGSAQRLTLLGTCPQLTVSGSGNRVAASRVGVIVVQGSRNTVTWTSALRGSAPTTRIVGSGNIVRTAPPRAAQPGSVRPSPARPAPSKTATRL